MHIRVGKDALVTVIKGEGHQGLTYLFACSGRWYSAYSRYLNAS